MLLSPDARQPHNQNKRIVRGSVELLKNSVGGSLGIFARGNRFDVMALHAIGGEEERVSFADGKNRGLKSRQLRPDHTTAEKKHFRKIRAARDDSRERAHHIADAQPRHHSVSEINRSNTENDAARGTQRAVTLLDERDDWLVDAVGENGCGGFCGVGGFFAVANAVNRSEEKAARPAAQDMAVARSAFTGKHEIGNTEFDELRI
jgi:hypothetical protein